MKLMMCTDWKHFEVRNFEVNLSLQLTIKLFVEPGGKRSSRSKRMSSIKITVHNVERGLIRKSVFNTPLKANLKYTLVNKCAIVFVRSYFEGYICYIKELPLGQNLKM